jgi:excisionase family DNA binding protein
MENNEYHDYQVLRPVQAAKILGVSKEAVCRLLAIGSLPKVRLTVRAIGVRFSDLKAYIERQTTTGAIA